MKLNGRIADPENRGHRGRQVLGRVERWGIPVAMVVSGFLASAAVVALLNAALGALAAAGAIQVAGFP